MKFNYKIEYNHSLNDYKKIVKNKMNKYVRLSLKEVEDFDKKFGAYSYDEIKKKNIYQYRLLNKNHWWFINGYFYEVPLLKK